MPAKTPVVSLRRQLKGDNTKPGFIRWPDWAVLKVTGTLSMIFGIVFYSIYTLTDYITGLHSYRVKFYFEWEPETPFFPEMSIIYVSIIPAFLLMPFVVREIEKFRVLFRVFIIETVIAAAFFLALPSENVFFYVQVDGHFAWLHKFADTVNLTYNELPSLHVAFSCTLALVIGSRLGMLGRIAAGIWAILVFISTMVNHHHHLLGALSGVVLFLIVLIAQRKNILQLTVLPSPGVENIKNKWKRN